MQTQNYDLGDFIEMESMQFVNPHEINPLIENESLDTPSVYSQVSSNAHNMPQIGAQNNIKLKMEEFSDLSCLLSGTQIDLSGAAVELDTPVFDKDAFDFTTQPSVKSNENICDLKVKVEYNAQIYSCGKNMYRNLTSATDNKVQNKENYSISILGNKQPEMNLYQPYAQNISSRNKTDDMLGHPYQELPMFDSTAAHNEMSSNSDLSVNNNIKYSYSTVPSPQEDRYSYISSPGNDQQADFSMPDHDYLYDTKPRLNLMTDQFKFPIKSEIASVLNTPDVIDEVVNLGPNFNILDLVNNEDITILSADEDLVASLTSPSTSSMPPSTPSVTSSQPSSPIKKSIKRRISQEDDDDDDEDYLPPTKKKSTVRLTDIDIEDSNSSDDSEYETKKSVRKTKTSKPRGRPPKRADSVSSDMSRDPDVSKYRELRDKNNEASRKSRLKRKMKEIEYEQEADELRSKNIRLKAQVEELEKMVSTFRNNLFKILVNK